LKLIALSIAAAALASAAAASAQTANPNKDASASAVIDDALTAASAELLEDQCLVVPGYMLFRSQLVEAAMEGDGERFRALFHPKGSMRVWGIGGSASSRDWGLDRPEAGRMWAEVDQLLSLGCVIRGDELLLPAMASMAKDGTRQEDSVVAIDNVDLRTEPNDRAPLVRHIARGETLSEATFGEDTNWIQVNASGKRGYVPASNVRSPLSFQMVLVRYEGQWRIREFGSGV